MKKIVLRSFLLLFFSLGVLVSCNKETKTEVVNHQSVIPSGVITERQDSCCGIIHIFMKDTTKPILGGVPFQIWWADDNHSWHHTSCIFSTTKYNLSICHKPEEALILYLLPCSPGQTIPPPSNGNFNPFDGWTYDLRVAKTNDCGEYYYNPPCYHWFFGTWPNKFNVNPPPIPVGTAGGYYLETNLCCY